MKNRISQLLEKMKSKNIKYYLNICNIIRAAVSNSRSQFWSQSRVKSMTL